MAGESGDVEEDVEHVPGHQRVHERLERQDAPRPLAHEPQRDEAHPDGRRDVADRLEDARVAEREQDDRERPARRGRETGGLGAEPPGEHPRSIIPRGVGMHTASTEHNIPGLRLDVCENVL